MARQNLGDRVKELEAQLENEKKLKEAAYEEAIAFRQTLKAVLLLCESIGGLK